MKRLPKGNSPLPKTIPECNDQAIDRNNGLDAMISKDTRLTPAMDL